MKEEFPYSRINKDLLEHNSIELPACPFVGRLQHKPLSHRPFYTTDLYLHQLFPSQRELQLCSKALHYLQHEYRDALLNEADSGQGNLSLFGQSNLFSFFPFSYYSSKVYKTSLRYLLVGLYYDKLAIETLIKDQKPPKQTGENML